MTKKDVLQLLEKNKNARGLEHWKRSGDKNMKSFGLGLTQVRQLAKKVGRDHKLALDLWAPCTTRRVSWQHSSTTRSR